MLGFKQIVNSYLNEYSPRTLLVVTNRGEKYCYSYKFGEFLRHLPEEDVVLFRYPVKAIRLNPEKSRYVRLLGEVYVSLLKSNNEYFLYYYNQDSYGWNVQLCVSINKTFDVFDDRYGPDDYVPIKDISIRYSDLVLLTLMILSEPCVRDD